MKIDDPRPYAEFVKIAENADTVRATAVGKAAINLYYNFETLEAEDMSMTREEAEQVIESFDMAAGTAQNQTDTEDK